MTRFVPKTKNAAQKLAYPQPVYVGATVRLACGCVTRRIPDAVSPSKGPLYWCHGSYQKAVKQ